MPLFDPKTYSPEQAAGLTNVPGQSLSQTNTPQQIQAAQAKAPTTVNQPAPAPQQPTNPSGFTNLPSLTGFAGILDTMRTKLGQNQTLMDQKNIILKQLYDRQPTPEEMQKLSPSQLMAIQSGNQDLVSLEVRTINDNLQGRSQTLDQSISYLTNTYQQQQTELDKQKALQVATVNNVLTRYDGDQATQIFSKYTPEQRRLLEQEANLPPGFLDKVPSTLTAQKTDLAITKAGLTTVGGGGIVAGSKVGSSDIAGDVEDVLSGKNTLFNIRQTMGRTNQAAAYMNSMRAAIRKIDPSFDFIASDAGGKFVSSTFYQKAVSAITTVEPNIDKVVELSNQVDRFGVAYVDNLLQKGNIQIGNQKVANFRQAQKIIADEIGLALGQGSVSDMKLQLGFDITDPSLSKEVFASNMGLVKDFIENRKKALQEQRYSSSTVSPSSSGSDNSYDSYVKNLGL